MVAVGIVVAVADTVVVLGTLVDHMAVGTGARHIVVDCMCSALQRKVAVVDQIGGMEPRVRIEVVVVTPSVSAAVLGIDSEGDPGSERDGSGMVAAVIAMVDSGIDQTGAALPAVCSSSCRSCPEVRCGGPKVCGPGNKGGRGTSEVKVKKVEMVKKAKLSNDLQIEVDFLDKPDIGLGPAFMQVSRCFASWADASRPPTESLTYAPPPPRPAPAWRDCGGPPG